MSLYYQPLCMLHTRVALKNLSQLLFVIQGTRKLSSRQLGFRSGMVNDGCHSGGHQGDQKIILSIYTECGLFGYSRC